MLEVIQLAGSLGVGAFLGFVIFLMYRADKRATEKRLSNQNKKYEKIIASNTRALNRLTKAISNGIKAH